MFRVLQPFAFLCACSFAGPVSAQQLINLLSDVGAKAGLVAQPGVAIDDESALFDQNQKTLATLTSDTGTIDLVYHFDDQTTTISNVSIATVGLKDNAFRMEVLASSLSAATGYQSMRAEPLRASTTNPQVIRIEPGAAKWVMVRFTSAEPNARITISELALNGFVGEPTSKYKFDESPVEAIQVLASLSESVKVSMTDAESKMFEDAKDGKFDDIRFAEASLLSSGVLDTEKRNEYLKRIDQFTQQVSSTIATDAPVFERGRQLLDALHSGPFQKGYKEHQTDVSTVFDSQTYNCVSSATLYNIIARRTGLDARGIEVPDHAFSVLYDGTQHVDIETTTRAGFNPSRNRSGLDQFHQQTGFVYIPERNRSQRREIGETGMVAITYYNHGVELTEKKQFSDALISYFKALSLDPENKSAIKNVLTVLANWSSELAQEGDFEQAIEVLDVGLDLAPNDWRLKHNHLAIWQQRVKKLIADGRSDEALTRLKAIDTKTNEYQLKNLQAWIFLEAAEKLAAKAKWKEAIATAEEGLQQVDEATGKEIRRWRTGVTLRWTTSLLKENRFSEVVDILESAVPSDSDYRIKNRLAFAVQEWGNHERETKGEKAGQELLHELAQRFPKIQGVRSVSNNYTDKAAKVLIEKGDLDGALKVYAEARKKNPKDYRLKKSEESVWLMKAKPFMDSRDWKTAAEVYRDAHTARPDSFPVKQNLTYIVQEWSRDVANTNGPAAGEKIVKQWTSKLPNLHTIKQMNGNLIRAEVRRFVEAKEFKKAVSFLSKNRESFLSDYEFDQRVAFIFQEEAKPFRHEKSWGNVIGIYNRGFIGHPKNRSIKENLVQAWDLSAKEHIEAEEWNRAIEIYKKALKSVPGDSTLTNNLRFCKSKLSE